jgi:outer membrane assembly lipoprotein YfiO
MNSRIASCVAGSALIVAQLLTPAASAALPGVLKVFGGNDPKTAPDASELAQQESKAMTQMTEANRAESDGDEGKAAKLYLKISESYPFTKSAATAVFRAAQLLEKQGKRDKAFDTYQTLIDSHSQSTEFATALERQFAIASDIRSNRGGVIGFGSATSDEIIARFEKVIANGNRSIFAPKAQYAIGEIYAESTDADKVDKSKAAFQKVVDNYPESPEAPEAAYKIGKVNFSVAKSTRDASNLMQAKEAFESAVTLFGDSPHATEARENLLEINANDAAKAFKTGQFYEKKGQLKAAAIYYNEVLKCPSAADLDAAKEKLANLTANDPKLLDQAPGLERAQSALAVPAKTNTKGRADYFGPPVPRPKPKMRLDNEAPFQSLPEPELPGGGSSEAKGGGLLPSPTKSGAPGAALPELPPPPTLPSTATPAVPDAPVAPKAQ